MRLTDVKPYHAEAPYYEVDVKPHHVEMPYHEVD